jgi:UPF0755 protein
MGKRLLTLAVLVLVLIAAGFGANLWLARAFVAPGPMPQPLRVQVEQGMSARAVLGLLQKEGALRNARLTELYLRLRGRRLGIKAGEYEIPARASAAQIVTLLAEGRVVLEQLTVVEGSTFADFRRGLAEHPKVRATLAGKSDAEVMLALGHGGESPEGLFFPDTYRFAAGTSDLDILKLAYDRMHVILAECWAQRAQDLPVHSAYEALVLASIIEKETGLASERPVIAGVFVSRLRKGMRLQSDPTVIYGLGARYDGDIHDRDLVSGTPYNTYTRSGLPPTPIALPGRESLLATVRPDVTGALYFVATGDGDGAHHFSATLEEHNAAVQHYLARLRAQQGLAPAVHTSPAPQPRHVAR